MWGTFSVEGRLTRLQASCQGLVEKVESVGITAPTLMTKVTAEWPTVSLPEPQTTGIEVPEGSRVDLN